jgi:hypothetical protein
MGKTILAGLAAGMFINTGAIIAMACVGQLDAGSGFLLAVFSLGIAALALIEREGIPNE